MIKDKIAIITGSSRGIGNEVAKLFLENGAKVAICGSKKENAIEAIEKLTSFGINKENMLPLGLDMTNDKSIKEGVEEVINKWGKIDILVNNAGITSNVSLLEETMNDFEKMFNINVFGVVRMTKEVLKYMKNTGGSIINTSSMVGINGGRNQSAYASSKSAVNGLTISLAKELGMYNIRVNAIAPGVVGTDMMKESVTEEMKNMLINMTPLKKMATPKDLAGAYLYLASDASNFTTGTIIKVDGGLMM